MTQGPRYGDFSEIAGRLSEGERRFEARRRGIGLFLGPAVFVFLLFLPMPGLSAQAARLAAVMGLVLVWWITEAVPIPVTSLIGPSLAAVLGVADAKALYAPFGNPIIFLFLGSFVLAEAMSAHGLDRRIAYGILGLKGVGSSSIRIMISFAALSAGLSMWLSNSATTAMLLPISMGILSALAGVLSRDGRGVDAMRLRYGSALMLACAYGSSVGGIATPVGTPPNLITLGLLNSLAGIRITFFQWMLVTLPIAVVMLVAAVIILRVALPPEVKSVRGGLDFIAEERAKLGPLSRGEKNVLLAFGAAVFLWVAPGVLGAAAGSDSAVYRAVKDALPESSVALLAASLLFVLPSDWKARKFTMTWNEAVRVDWGTLLLFGGGLSLGAAMFQTGLAQAAGEAITNATGARSLIALTVLFAVIGNFFTEVTSNTATATMLIPLAVAAAQSAGLSPLEPALACCLGCSMAFMLPVATPPNAIVYGSGVIPITRMIRIGFWLDLAAAVVVPVLVLLMVPLVLG